MPGEVPDAKTEVDVDFVASLESSLARVANGKRTSKALVDDLAAVRAHQQAQPWATLQDEQQFACVCPEFVDAPAAT